MADLSSGKIAEVIFEKYIETHEQQDKMVDLVEWYEPDAADMQNADDVIWETIQQHRPVLTGFDLTGQEQGIIEETVPLVLEDPKNDLIEQRADKVRDKRFWERAGEESAKKQISTLNKTIADRIIEQGSLFYESDTASGFDFVSQAQALLNERQSASDDRVFLMNDRDTKKFAEDLAGRQTVQGRPEDAAWKRGQIGNNVAQFDIYTASFLDSLDGGNFAGTTITADVSDKPEGGTVDPITKAVTNTDWRVSSDIPFTDVTGLKVGDKIKFDNGGTDVLAVGLMDKTETISPMTFTVVEINGLNVKVFPKPIAADDLSLTALEQAYANINTQILNGANVVQLNTETKEQQNIFFAKDSVCVTGGNIPAQYFAEFEGSKVIESTMSNGQRMYMLYGGDVKAMNFFYRIFTWWGVTVKNPSTCGSASAVPVAP